MTKNKDKSTASASQNSAIAKDAVLTGLPPTKPIDEPTPAQRKAWADEYRKAQDGALKPENVRTYVATFIGRQVGAIGKFYGITAQVEARNEQEATLSLYDRFEHISNLELKVLGH